jgi:hypothetical protein
LSLKENNVNIKFTDYVKIENMKRLVLVHLENMGLKNQVRAMSDDEINKIIAMMGYLTAELRELPSDEERIKTLVYYVVTLWTRLLVDYKADLGE